MPSIAIPICEGLKDHINAGTYSLGSVTSERVWAPKQSREEMQQLQVLVVCDLKQTTAVTRGNNQHEVRPAIFVQKSVNPFDNVDVDVYAELVEEIEARVLRQSIAGADWVSQTEAELSDVYLWEMRAFIAAFEITYRTFS